MNWILSCRGLGTRERRTGPAEVGQMALCASVNLHLVIEMSGHRTLAEGEMTPSSCCPRLVLRKKICSTNFHFYEPEPGWH